MGWVIIGYGLRAAACLFHPFFQCFDLWAI
jgi:hypothetical protein